MAYITGEASNHFNLLEVLRDFLKTNPALVAAGQNWTQVGGTTGAIAHNSFVSLRGPGMSGTDQIFLTLQAYSDVPQGIYCLRMRGHTAYNPAVPSIDPPGNNSPWAYAALVNSPIRYWIVANGRRFVMVASANNRYDVMYGGFILPEHLPSDWSYPLLIGGSASGYIQASDTSIAHRNFWDTRDTASLFVPAQTWRTFNNYSNTGNVNSSLNNQMYSIDWSSSFNLNALARTIDNQPWISPGRICELGGSQRNTLGVYDGVFFTPSQGAVIEGLITVDGVDHLVVSNVFRNADSNLAAIRLE